MKLGWLVLLLLFAGPAWSQDADRLSQELDHPQWKVRDRATKALIRMGRGAVPALRRVIVRGSPEARWRAKEALFRIFPEQSFFDALALVDQDKLDLAVARIKPLLAILPSKTRPNPAWTLQIIEQVRGLAPDDQPSLTRAIAYHNLQCLLREAGISSGRIREQARRLYRPLISGNRRAARLLAVLDMEAGDRKAAEKHWKLGKPTKQEQSSFWTLYDIACYKAVQGKRTQALDALARAIFKNPGARREARISSDFHMLQGLPEFDQLIEGKIKPGGTKK